MKKLLLCFLYLSISLVFTAENVTKTDDLPDMSSSYKISQTDSPLNDILWCGGSKEIVLVLTDNGSVYRSTDKGFSWTKQVDIFQKTGYVELEKGEKVGVVKKIMKSPSDDNLLIFMGSEGINWISEDCGSSIKAMNQGRNVNEFQFHPTERSWLLAAAWSLCEDFVDEPCQIYKELFVSTNLGQDWKLIEDYVVQFSWAAYDKTHIESGNVPKERILLAHEPLGKGHQNIVGWSENVHLSYSDDFFKTFKSLIKFGNKFLLSEKYLFVAHVTDQSTQEVGLKVSDPNLRVYQFSDVQLPLKHFKEHSYTILDSKEGQVFLHVNHHDEYSKHGNIYISDSTGRRFSTSLLHNVRNLEGQCDFNSLQGLEGIFVANIYDDKKLKGALSLLESDAENEKSAQSKRKNKGLSQYDKLKNYKKTVITFDKGGIWKPLQAPLKDSRGKKITCPNDDCTLHLHSITDMTFGPVYSTQNSIGLLIGTGNVGYYLQNKADEINTYLSRDAGLTWSEIAKGSHIYEIGDHGSIIVMADDQQATDYIEYSWNEGLTFEKLIFTKKPIEVTNIIIEPSNTGTSFILYGTTTDGYGVLVGIDFSSFHLRVCKGSENPNTEDSDFEYWSPNGQSSPSCLLGRRVSYVRRKRENQCFNGEEFERKRFIENCECTEEDWECDLGFSRDKGGPCKSTSSKTQESIDYNPPQNCSDYYYVSQGYRKVSGDSCVGGVSHEPLKLPCPGFLIEKNWSFGKILLILALIAIIYLLISKNTTSDWIKEKLNEIKEFIIDFYIKLTGNKQDNSGYGKIDKNQEPDFSKMVFEDNEERAEPIEDHENFIEKDQGKKLAERGGVNTAKKNIPALGKPKNADKKQKEDSLLHDDEEDEENGIFDPRK